MLLTDVEGVKDSDGHLLSQLTSEEVRKHIDEGTIRDGMIPKVNCCTQALASGVSRTHIVDAESPFKGLFQQGVRLIQIGILNLSR